MIIYKVKVSLEEVGQSYETFAAAFEAFYNATKELVARGTSWQILETACWIEYKDMPIYFYDARDIACAWKILVNGKIAQPTTDERTEKFIRIGLDTSRSLENVRAALAHLAQV